MYPFQSYNPAHPRTVTSFKGNQKLIFEGYRYNIHHIVPAKGVKTWRCVCAKKLTSARSWCKGRAETWETDTRGMSKGEHNHEPEHEVAELEYFKSQLILAAIEQPSANLNDLIDEAVGYMSEGVSFGSRESLKKSLMVARKSAENGGFKLKCYKNSIDGKHPSRSQQQGVGGGDEDVEGDGGSSPPLVEHATMVVAPAAQSNGHSSSGKKRKSNGAANELSTTSSNTTNDTLKMLADSADPNGAMLSLFQMQLARQCQQQQQFDESLMFNAANSFGGGGRDASTALLTSLVGQQLSAAAAAAVAASMNQQQQQGLPEASCSSASSSDYFHDSGIELDLSAVFQQQQQQQQQRANSASARSTPITSTANDQDAIQLRKKTARVNNIFNKLSRKAEVAASCSTPPPPSSTTTSGGGTALEGSTPALRGSSSPSQQQQQQLQAAFPVRKFASVQTQTTLHSGHFSILGGRRRRRSSERERDECTSPKQEEAGQEDECQCLVIRGCYCNGEEEPAAKKVRSPSEGEEMATDN